MVANRGTLREEFHFTYQNFTSITLGSSTDFQV